MRDDLHRPRQVGARDDRLYSVYGLAVLSDFDLPQISVLQQTSAVVAPDIRIEKGRTPREIPGGRAFAPGVVASDRACLLNYEGIGRFYVEDGRRIVGEQAEDAAEEDLSVYLLGSCMGAILHMRGRVPLHVSALTALHGAVAFTGDSGAGKSTLAASLNHQYGLPLICDDVGVLTQSDVGLSLVSGVNTLKLWEDALCSLGRTSDGLRRDLTRHDKFHAIEVSKFTRQSAPLRHLVQLTWGQEVSYQKVTGRRAFKIALESVYRPEFAALFSNIGAIASTAASIAAQAEVGVLTRPRDHSRSTEIAALLQSLLLNPKS